MQNKIVLSCFYKKKKKNLKKIANGLDRTVLATGSCGPTPVLGVHEIATYAQFFMLKKPVFISVLGFYDLTSRSGPILETMLGGAQSMEDKEIPRYPTHGNLHSAFCKGDHEDDQGLSWSLGVPLPETTMF